jgi:outer membrane murein-binding lipoprotein Lpp
MSDTPTTRDTFLARLGGIIATTVIVGALTWVGVGIRDLSAGVGALHETSSINTLKIEQIQAALKPLPTLTAQVSKLQYDVDRLKAHAAREEARHEDKTENRR